MTYKLRLLIIHCIMPLFIGVLIYIFFRTTELKMCKWFSLIGIKDYIITTKIFFLDVKSYLPNWIIFSLPDGLWTYSFSAMLYYSWDEIFLKYRILLIFPFCCLFILEIIQYKNENFGTFDFADLIVSFIMNMLLIKNLKLNNYEKKD